MEEFFPVLSLVINEEEATIDEDSDFIYDFFRYIVEKKQKKRIIYIIIPVHNGYIVVKVIVHSGRENMDFETRKVRAVKNGRLADSTIIKYFAQDRTSEALNASIEQGAVFDHNYNDGEKEYHIHIERTNIKGGPEVEIEKLTLDFDKIKIVS